MPRIDLNCDMGESFGAYQMGNDEAVLDHVSSANIACGFHAGDPRTMHHTVRMALADLDGDQIELAVAHTALSHRRVDAAREAVRSLGIHALHGGGAADVDEVPGRAFQQDAPGLAGHFGFQTAHHAGDRERSGEAHSSSCCRADGQATISTTATSALCKESS